MKKIFGIMTAVLMAAPIFAYNPPVQGENFTGFINPQQLTVGNSVAGGPLFNISPSSVTVNPALGAYQNRVSLDLGYTAIFTGDSDHPYGHSFGTGILIPTKYFNMSAEIFGTGVESYKMQLADSINLKTTFSKEVAENFAIGVGISGGYLWGAGVDWSLTADVGAVYKWGELGPMHNFRLAASVLNLGKVYNKADVVGVFGAHDDKRDWGSFPGFLTIRGGAAAEFVNTKQFVLGLSLDVTTPFFQNVIFDAGVQMKIMDLFFITSSWQIDCDACSQGKNSWIPTVGLTFKFGLDTSFTKKEDWQKSDMQVGAAWKNVDGGVNAFSAGAIINLGQPDRQAPKIKMNDDDVEEEE
ncbi:MAG: hypothetical protein KBS84_05590 [Treponema sp.]|nr:hypothetical protein [Candidatus Treponema scatequi]